MKEIKINKTENGFTVSQGNLETVVLSWEGMIGTLVKLTKSNLFKCSGNKTYVPKDGDIVYARACNEHILIYRDMKPSDCTFGYVDYVCGNLYDCIESCLCNEDLEEIRPATKKEKKQLLDALHEQGKDWDAKNKKVVCYKWIPKDNEEYFYVSPFLEVERTLWWSSNFDLNLADSNNIFKTRKEAEEAAKKFKDILNKK